MVLSRGSYLKNRLFFFIYLFWAFLSKEHSWMALGRVHGFEMGRKASTESEISAFVKKFHPVLRDLEATLVRGDLFGKEIPADI